MPTSHNHIKASKNKKEVFKNKKHTFTEMANIFKDPNSKELVTKLLSEAEIRSYIKYIIKEYAALDKKHVALDKDLFNETELREAIRLGFIEPDTNPETSSWLTTVVVYAVPTILVGLVALYASKTIIHSARALPTGDGSNAEPVDNSDVVHHRNARAVDVEEVVVAKYLTLANNNCIAFGFTHYEEDSPAGRWNSRKVYAKCFNGPCQGQAFNSTEGAQYLDWGRGGNSKMEIKTVNDEQAQVTFAHRGIMKYDGHEGYKDYKVEHICDLSPKEVNKALIDPNFESAIAQKKTISQLLLSTTIAPSSTSLKTSTPTESPTPAKASTTTKHSTTMAKETTTHVEPSNAPFNGVPIPTPTSTPQNTTNQGWSLKDVVAVIFAADVVSTVCGTIASVVYKKYNDIRQKCCSKSGEASHSVNEPSSDYLHCYELGQLLLESMASTEVNIISNISKIIGEPAPMTDSQSTLTV